MTLLSLHPFQIGDPVVWGELTGEVIKVRQETNMVVVRTEDGMERVTTQLSLREHQDKVRATALVQLAWSNWNVELPSDVEGP